MLINYFKITYSRSMVTPLNYLDIMVRMKEATKRKLCNSHFVDLTIKNDIIVYDD